MRKLSILFIFLISIVILFSGCSRLGQKPPYNDSETQSAVPTDGEDDTMLLDDFFDFEMKSKPTNSDMEQICVGMPFDAVIDAIGKPHGMADGVSVSGYFKWITFEGDRYIILFLATEDIENVDQMTFSEYYHYTEVFSISSKPLGEEARS